MSFIQVVCFPLILVWFFNKDTGEKNRGGVQTETQTLFGAPSGSIGVLSAFLCAKLLFFWTHRGMAGRQRSLTTSRITELMPPPTHVTTWACQVKSRTLMTLTFVSTPAGTACYLAVHSLIGFQMFEEEENISNDQTATNFNSSITNAANN